MEEIRDPETFEIPEGVMEDDAIPFSIQSELDGILYSRNAQDQYKKIHWSPTDLGKCLCGVYHKRLGTKPDKEFDGRQLRVFAVGKFTEDWVISVLREKYPEIQTQIRIEIPEWDCTGYADAMLNDEVLEFKTQHSKSFWYMTKGHEGANIQHKMQLWTYLKALNKPKGRIVYISKDDNAIQEYPVYLADEKLALAVECEFHTLMTAWETKIPPTPAPTFVDGKRNWVATYCDHHQTCTGDPQWLQKAEALSTKKVVRL